MTYYRVSKDGVEKSDQENGNWLVLREDAVTKETLSKINDEYSLPDELFSARNEAEEVTRFESLKDTKLKNPMVLVLMDLYDSKTETIEERLEPVTILKADDLLITHVCRESSLIDHLLENNATDLNNFEKIIARLAYTTYRHFIAELSEIKEEIDKLDQAARKAAGKEELVKLTDTQRVVVYIDQTLLDQKEVLDKLLTDEDFLTGLADEKLSYDIRVRQRHAEKMVNIYRDLLESISNLFVSMMDRSLNNLMKYLDSVALIISIPSLFAGVWGMNVGGLPGTKSKIGFVIVMLAAVLVSIIFGIYLRNKDYSK
ncbi:magnesium transporter CorA family protein [Companilactobacillus alimentarius]|uniref:magnesium transporter CorA family protein n=1 Tax=Companilactobacillus alimentarius TaxID=1602 RepID=UPI0028B7E257|nr:magnesium transporter CorA family protein [Companilactobacillus alimentarius]MDT6951655.1 magnesium transporter CorA family protein [Companilactobacillus alimentarius]